MTAIIGFYVFSNFQILDLAGPLATFQLANRIHGGDPYELRVVSQYGGLVRSSAQVDVVSSCETDFSYDTLIFAGGTGCLPPEPIEQLASSAARQSSQVRRIGSVCTGAFILGAAGLLNNRRATTHWRYARHLQRLFPQVAVDAEQMFINSDNVWTSGGMSAGIDLSMALIAEDLGLETSRAVARDLVLPHRRQGRQSQFSALMEIEPHSERIRTALKYARDNLHERLTIDRLAEVACLSTRQFGRRFLLEIGETPARAIERLRAEVARTKVEDGSDPIEVIAKHVGFVDPERMRRAFIRIYGHAPRNLRRSAREFL